MSRPAKIQISRWSLSSLSTFWKAKDAKFVYADNEDSDQIALCECTSWSESSLGAHARR